MEKINFENLPSENTPINQDNLNLMQGNIEKSVVAVGKTQPSTSENVWIKKGKNLFNKNAVLKNCELLNDGANVGYNVLWFVSDYIEVEPNTTYYLSGNRTGGTTNAFYDESKTFISYVSKITGDITTPSNAKYIRFNGKLSEIDNNIMLEQNSTATTYEAYINKEILVKNDNGVFEKFLGEPKEIFKLVKTCTTGSSAHHGYYYVDLYMGNDGININNLIQINAKIGGNALFLYQWISDYEIRIRTNTPNTNVTIYLFYIV